MHTQECTCKSEQTAVHKQKYKNAQEATNRSAYGAHLIREKPQRGKHKENIKKTKVHKDTIKSNKTGGELWPSLFGYEVIN